jgi:myo-inositol-1(or 4)-monophosphatase
MAEFLRTFGEIDDAVSGLLGERLAVILPGVPAVDDLRGEIPETGEAWVMDAVDGAVQYLHGLPQWCVSVALVRDGRAVAAVLHNPVAGETYAAGDAERAAAAARRHDRARDRARGHQPPAVRRH